MNDTSDQNPQATPNPQPSDASPENANGSEDEASVVWLVSYADDDDRELRPPQIAEALRLGEINAETIVWRQGAEDWLPLAKVPELAKLLSASGETATAPLVAPNPALLRRAAAKPPEPNLGAVKTPSVRPMIAGRAVPMAKGTTKLGLPKFDPTKDRKPEATPLPAQQPAAVRSAKAAVDMTPTIPKSPATPQTPTVPKAQAAPLTPTKSRVDTLDKADLFASGSDEEEAPISIEPEFMRPPSPAPARAMQRAKALSPGTLGMKKPAPPPRPPMKSTPDAEPPKQEPPKQEPPKQEAPAQAAAPRAKKAPPSPPRKAQPSAPAITVSAEPALTPDPGTPSLGTLAAPVRAEATAAEPKRADDGLLKTEELLARALALDPATTGAESFASAGKEASKPVAAPAAPIEKPAKPESASATVSPSGALLAPPLAARSAESTDAPVSQARPSASAKPTGKGSWPILAAVGAVALIAVLFARLNRDPGAQPANPETPTATTVQPAEPTRAAPAEPAAPAPTATEAPAPAMTAESAPAEPAPVPVQPDTPSAAPKEKPAAIAAAKTEAAGPQEPKSAAPAPQPAAAAKAETKPAETKPTAPAAPEPKEVAVGGDFDKAAAGAALTGAAQEASGCRKEGDPSGVAVVHVTFSNAGRATRAVIEGPPFAGTQTGGCIAATLRKATVPPYGGDRVTVTKKVVIR